MKNFYWSGIGLFLIKEIRSLFRLRNNRSRTLFSLILPFTFLLFSNSIHAQELRKDSGADGQLEIQPLTVGDSIPEAFWHHQLKALNLNVFGKKEIALNHYRNKELIILDYWGVFCIPCIYSIDSLHTLAEEFGGRLQVITATLDPREKVQSMVNRRNWKLPAIVSDSIIRSYFPHRVVPHQIWIKDGKVLAIGSGKASNRVNIEKVLADSTVQITIKKDRVPLDRNAPLLINRDYTTEITQRTFSNYISGNGAYSINNNTDGINMLSFSNMSRLNLYRMALQLPSLGHIAVVGLDGGWYSRDTSLRTCYQLMTSVQDKSKIDSIVKKDLDDYFQVSSGYEVQRKNVWVIKRQSPTVVPLDSSKIPARMINLVYSLNNTLENEGKYLFVSEVDPKLEVPYELVKIFRKSGIDKFQQELADYGLKAVLEDREIELFVIRKRN